MARSSVASLGNEKRNKLLKDALSKAEGLEESAELFRANGDNEEATRLRLSAKELRKQAVNKYDFRTNTKRADSPDRSTVRLDDSS